MFNTQKTHGFEAVWQAESRLVRDAMTCRSAAFAATTSTHQDSASGVINNWTRNAAVIARHVPHDTR